MKKIVIAVVVEKFNMKEVKALKRGICNLMFDNEINAADVIVSGKKEAVASTGAAFKKAAVRLIGCNQPVGEVFKFVHNGPRFCAWAIKHADIVMTVGKGELISKAKAMAAEQNKSCYCFDEGAMEKHVRTGEYDKKIIMQSEIQTVNSKEEKKITTPQEPVDVNDTESTSRARVVDNGKFELGGHVYQMTTDEVPVSEVVETINETNDDETAAMLADMKGAGYIELCA